MVLVCECTYFEVIGIQIVNIMNITILIHYTLMCFAFCLELVFTLLKKFYLLRFLRFKRKKRCFLFFALRKTIMISIHKSKELDIKSQIERTWYQVTNRKNLISSHKSKELDIKSQIERTWCRVTNRNSFQFSSYFKIKVVSCPQVLEKY